MAEPTQHQPDPSIRDSAPAGLRADWLAPEVAAYIRRHRLYGA